MVLSRIARNGLRRSGSAFNKHSHQKDSYSQGASTYRSFNNTTTNGFFLNLPHIERVNHVSFWSRGISITPQRQFPSAERLVEESDLESDEPSFGPGLEATKPGEKPRVVVLGTGWAACRFLKGIDTKVYDVVCISPRNHMVFTPLLASTCVGTLEFRSVAEPVSRIQTALAKDPNSYFYLASCTGVDTDKHEVSESCG